MNRWKKETVHRAGVSKCVNQGRVREEGQKGDRNHPISISRQLHILLLVTLAVISYHGPFFSSVERKNEKRKKKNS